METSGYLPPAPANLCSARKNTPRQASGITCSSPCLHTQAPKNKAAIGLIAHKKGYQDIFFILIPAYIHLIKLLSHRNIVNLCLFLRRLNLENHRAQPVVAAANRNSRLSDPVAVVEQPLSCSV